MAEMEQIYFFVPFFLSEPVYV
ncbi:hypothetical protein EMIT0P218_50337 [Pseudomonas sp. IT-P218]